MDIIAYIQSGVIEQYVLGLATAEEAAELEQLRVQYPEINDAVLNFEKTLRKRMFPLDKWEKQGRMWPKVVRSGQI